MSWQKQSGMGKAEFLRVALMMGAAQLANNVQAKKPEQGYYRNEDGANNVQRSPGREEDEPAA